MMEKRPQYHANPRYIDTRKRFTVLFTFETGQHSGVASSDPPERQPQQSRQEHQQEQIGEEEEEQQGQEWETRVQISHSPQGKVFCNIDNIKL